MLFAVARDAPFPENAFEYQRYIEDSIVRLIRAAGGKTLVLFTSYESLKHACDIARNALRLSGIKILRQGDDDRFRLLKMFREDKINLENFIREIEIRKLIEEENNAEFTEEFPLDELRALSVEGLEMEIDKILLKK